MICQGCGQKSATLHFTKILNGHKTEFHLCESCAREKGELLPGGSNGFSIHNLLSGLLNFEPNPSYGEATNHHQLRCETCGLTYSQFTKGGRFGCSDCYSYFKHQLDPMFRRIHGNTSHSGKVPVRSGGAIKLKRELEKLKQELQQSIVKEEFERAAQIRDRIRDLEKTISQDNL